MSRLVHYVPEGSDSFPSVVTPKGTVMVPPAFITIIKCSCKAEVLCTTNRSTCRQNIYSSSQQVWWFHRGQPVGETWLARLGWQVKSLKFCWIRWMWALTRTPVNSRGVLPSKTTTVVLITSKALSLIQSVSHSIPVSALKHCLCRWALHAKAFTGWGTWYAHGGRGPVTAF